MDWLLDVCDVELLQTMWLCFLYSASHGPLLCCCTFDHGCHVPAGGDQRPDSGSSGGSAWHHVHDGSEDEDGDLPPPVRRSWTQRLWGDGGGGGI